MGMEKGKKKHEELKVQMSNSKLETEKGRDWLIVMWIVKRCERKKDNQTERRGMKKAEEEN